MVLIYSAILFLHGLRVGRKGEASKILSVAATAAAAGLLILTLLSRAWLEAGVTVALYFWVPGVGQTVGLLTSGQRDRISPMSWVLTGAFLVALVAYLL